MPGRDNYYRILGLDPAEQDWPVIEKRIQDKRREWSKQKSSGNPDQKRQSARYLDSLGDIERVLFDPATRVAEAKEAKRLLQQEQKAGLKKLDEQIALFATEGRYTDDDIKLVYRQLSKAFGESEIEQRFKDAGLKKIATAETHTAPSRQGLDSVIARQIRTNLNHLSLTSLYAFLDRKPHSTPEELRRRAGEIYAEIKRIGKTDVDSTARSDLTGQCKTVFANADEKAKYDYTLSLQVLEELKPNLEVAGRDKFLTTDEMDVLIGQATARRVLPEDARAYIEEYAAKRKWGIQKPAGGARARPASMCGYCGALSNTPGATTCGACGEPLEVACPRCATPVPSTLRTCPKCGCDTGDAPLVRSLMTEGQHLFVQGDFDAARQRFQRVLVIWPGWEAAQNEISRIDARQSEIGRRIKAIEHLIAARELTEAAREIEQAVRGHGHSPFVKLERRVNDGIARAATLVAEGRRLQTAGKNAEALDRYTQALGLQSDCDEALRALASCPPDAPTTLRVNPERNGYHLDWHSPSATADTVYQVVRKADGPPAAPDDGATLKQVRGTTYADTDVPVGTLWYYAVYTHRGQIASPMPAVSGPHLRITDVEALMIVAGSGQVTLSWRRPPGCVGVEVWRGLGFPPKDKTDGIELVVSGDSCVDNGLTNGQTVGYLITAIFKDPLCPGRQLRTQGIHCTAVPVTPPEPVRDLIAERKGKTVTLKWTSPSRGAVQLRCADQPPVQTEGDLFDLRRLDELGKSIPVRTGGQTQFNLTNSTACIIPLSIEGETAIIGRWITVTALEPVTALESRPLGNNIVLTWVWPSAIDTVRICYRFDRFSTGPEDTDAASIICNRTEYDRHGCWELRAVEDRAHYFSLYSATAPDGPYAAPAERLESMGHRHEVRYRVVKKRWFPLLPWVRNMILELRGSQSLHLEELILVAKPNTLPVSPGDGVTIHEVKEVILRQGRADIPIPKEHWGRNMLVRLFFRRAADSGLVRLLHGSAKEMRLG
uniref:Double zinc ribbon n=1 Tax=Candidatus Kentrum sp. MB TaxID=2138164 RepID=A0A451BCY3_9GAMM|nr:MAG: Double zinc ribbon [Candidatus Kentron sp. MB]VFK33399.1 MAG: Double zinc ribbon [Candidatus Kentron sp. MB]VFK76146.1 MAG: Double zinc ribbon [Candidatus Kentron sp. MB]